MSDLIIYKDLLIDLFNLSGTDIHSIRHENQNGKTLIFVTLVSHPFDCPSCGNSHIKIKGYVDKTITHLQKTKDALLSSENNLRLANNKADDLSIKKLTKNAPAVREMFEELN